MPPSDADKRSPKKGETNISTTQVQEAEKRPVNSASLHANVDAADIDSAVDVRSGEELDLTKLDRYLRSVLGDLRTELTGDLRVKQFPGGASNLTYLLSYDQHEFVLRRPPFGRVAKAAHDMQREAKLIDVIRPFYSSAPKIIAMCSDHEVMGCDFFIMERIRGVVPRRELPSAWNLDPKQVREVCISGLEKLIALHTIDTSTSTLRSLGKGSGYVQRQISGWCDRWQNAQTPDAASFDKVMQWLNDKQPQDVASCLIHNDFRFDNLVYAPHDHTRIVGVLDWEMATLGDPLMDLGNSLAYWVQADDPQAMLQMRLQPTHTAGMLTRDEAIAYYLQRTGHQVENFNFYQVYGMFRLAVIAQQIYYRFYHGQTQDKRFSGFAKFAALLEHRCLQKLADYA